MPTNDIPKQINAAQPAFLSSIKAQNLLSFGPSGVELELGSLNVLIGPNGSGKSNLIDAISLLKAAPTDLAAAIRMQGGVQDWIWKGQPESAAVLEVGVNSPSVRHSVAIRNWFQTFQLEDERIDQQLPGLRSEGGAFFYHSGQRSPSVWSASGQNYLRLKPEELRWDASILSQLKDPFQYPDLTYLGFRYSGIALYREWSFGRRSIFRRPQQTDLPTDRLEEDFSNLAMFLNRLQEHPQAKGALLEHLRDLYDGLTDYGVRIEGGTVQVFFTEGHFTIPAVRLSDGSLRYLCLLAILCDPNPPSLICIEEPELGLHPDLLPKLADLLVDASQRCQLIVTTHSDVLVDALTDRPDSVVVCEKHDGQTEMKRLDPADVAPWLKKYRLGELWTRGHLGGNRW